MMMRDRRKIVLYLTNWRVLRWLVCLSLLLIGINHIAASAGSGVGGAGFANIAVQCLFKSYASVEQYQKSDVVYDNVTDVVTSKGRNPHGVSYFSADFATDKFDRHNYTRYYDIVLAPYFKRDINLLEVGVKKGGSLKMWRELFSPASRIFGIDIDPGIPSFPFDANIKTITLSSTADVYDDSVRNAFRGVQFDVIVDDGLHTRAGQYATFRNLHPFLKPDGVFVVEDVYHVRVDDFLMRNPTWTFAVHLDKSLEERVMFLYPPQSIAGRTDVGLLPRQARNAREPDVFHF
jgi:hypothetical protein